MTYLNIDVNHLRLPQYLGEDPANRGVWLSLLVYCVSVENGGRIVGCRTWNDRLWVPSCGVTKSEAETPSLLWQWEGEDLLVWGYPHDKQAQVQAGREGGKKGGRGHKKNPQTQGANPNLNPTINPGVSENTPPGFNGKEGKGREGKGMEAASAPELSNSPIALTDAQAYAKSWCASSAAMVAYEPAQVELWFADRDRKGWQASSGQVIASRDQAEKDLRFWLLKHKTGQTPSPPRREGHPGAGKFEKKESGGAAAHPLALPPCGDWKTHAAAICERMGWDPAVLPELNWSDLDSEAKQAVVDEFNRAREVAACRL